MKLGPLSTLHFGLILLLGACAQASSPPGAPPDRTAPRVISSVPEQGEMVPGFKGPVRIRFDETLSEKGPRPADMAAVSPESGDLEVSRHGSEIRIMPKQGFQNGRVYHVTVFQGLQDRFGNSRQAPYELIFSTGPDILATALGGLVFDRLTGKPINNGRVVAVNINDSAAYTTLTDTAGFFGMRSLPMGAYRVLAFVDNNRDRKLNGIEPRDSTLKALSTVRDTQTVELSLLARDTTPSRLLHADATDSLQVRLSFDDFMEAAQPLAPVHAQVWQLPDSLPIAGTLFHVREFEQRLRAMSDTTTRKPQTLRGPTPDTTRTLPEQELVWLPAQPLKPSTRFRVTVQGIRNISGLLNGGGSVVFESPARPRSIVPRDTTAVKPKKPDTTTVRH